MGSMIGGVSLVGLSGSYLSLVLGHGERALLV